MPQSVRPVARTTRGHETALRRPSCRAGQAGRRHLPRAFDHSRRVNMLNTPSPAGRCVMRQTPPRTLLQQLIRQLEASYETVTRQLNDFARVRDIDGTISVRHLRRLACDERASDGAPPTALPGTKRLLRE